MRAPSTSLPSDGSGAWSRKESVDEEFLLDIRRIAGHSEYRQCEALQERVWGVGDLVRVPALVLITAQDNGGLVLGAFHDDRLVGFVCSYPGLTPEGRLKHCSQLLAVDPECQGLGIGHRLKIAQRDAVRTQGIDLITWTFDPLASVNAHFNLVKLACTASTYLVDCYGTPVGGLNAGLSSDRLVAEWEIGASGAENRSVTEPVWVNRLGTEAGSGLVVNEHLDLDRNERVLGVEIPRDIQAMKRLNLDLARRWRHEVRDALRHFLSQGYRVVGFRSWQDGIRRCGYQLERSQAA